MCGRFTMKTVPLEVIEHFRLDPRADRQLPLFEPRYNIAPTQDVPVVRPGEGEWREIVAMRWGLIPSWSKEPMKGAPLINARAETVAAKPAFRAAFKGRRCLMPADGFYEWQAPPAGKKGGKQPYYIHRRDDAPFAFAALWERWSGDGPTLETSALVTTESAGWMSDIHHRAPVILSPGDYALWLDPDVTDADALRHLLEPEPHDDFVATPVSTYVNKVSNTGPRCVEEQRSLF